MCVCVPIVVYYYPTSGVIGAGLLVLSKYPIVSTLFHAWTVNGYCHRIQHADWFGGKGVGLCRIRIGDRHVHLYNAHVSVIICVCVHERIHLLFMYVYRRSFVMYLKIENPHETTVSFNPHSVNTLVDKSLFLSLQCKYVYSFLFVYSFK